MRHHFNAIRKYALAYAALEKLQRCENALFPIGDQKTGVIAEFYARLYVASRWPSARFIYGHPSEHAWDITVRRRRCADYKIQVKAVSSHSHTSRVSPIHPGWHELYLMRFNDEFAPIGFWVVSAAGRPWSKVTIEASTMPMRGVRRSGSAIFRDAADNLDELSQVLKRLHVPVAVKRRRRRGVRGRET